MGIVQCKLGKHEPILKIVEEGMRLAVVANLTTSVSEQREHFELGCEIISSRIMDVKTDYEFRLPSERLTVQVPLHQVATACVSTILAPGQTWLIDPHVSSTKSIRNETSVPFQGKIPCVGRSFKNVAISTFDQHMIVLLCPELNDRK